MARRIDVDVVALGAGFGGLTCALVAHDLGLNALVVEKSELLGGVTAMSGGHIWVPGNPIAKSAGINDSWQAGAAHVERIGAGTADRARLESLLSNALAACAYLESSTELSWNLISLADYYAETAASGLMRGRYLEPSPLSAAGLGEWRERTRRGTMFPDRMMFEELLRLRRDGVEVGPEVMEARERDDVRCGGAAIAVGLVAALLARGVPIMTGVSTTALTRSPGDCRVTGVAAVHDGEEVVISASRGVLLSTGGYDRNPDLVRLKDGLDGLGTAGHAGLTGDSLTLAGEQGAQTAYNAKPFLLGIHVDGEIDDEGAPSWRVVSPRPHSIFVNSRGQRFADEAHYVSVSHAMRTVDGRVQERPNLPAYLICDSRYRQLELAGFGADDALPGSVVESSDLEELARMLGIDGAGLKGAVEKFNAAVRRGRDEDYQRGETPYDRRLLPAGSTAADTLGEIERAPYYGVRLDPVGMGFANTGLVGDVDGRVLNWRGDVIDGLYAAGNSLAMLEIGSGYQSGFANMRGMTYGFLAARHMAGLPSTPTAP